MDATGSDAGGNGRSIRRLLLWVMLVGILGLGIELALIEHFDEPLQWIPLVALGAGLLVVVALLVRSTRGGVRTLQAISLAYLVAGGLGVYLHLDGNLEWEREDDPSASGPDLLARSLAGAIPLLAPGALAQLGLIGLIVGHRHPALHRRAATPVPRGADTSSRERR
jgi:hypothetical protein